MIIFDKYGITSPPDPPLALAVDKSAISVHVESSHCSVLVDAAGPGSPPNDIHADDIPAPPR